MVRVTRFLRICVAGIPLPQPGIRWPRRGQAVPPRSPHPARCPTRPHTARIAAGAPDPAYRHLRSEDRQPGYRQPPRPASARCGRVVQRRRRGRRSPFRYRAQTCPVNRYTDISGRSPPHPGRTHSRDRWLLADLVAGADTGLLTPFARNLAS